MILALFACTPPDESDSGTPVTGLLALSAPALFSPAGEQSVDGVAVGFAEVQVDGIPAVLGPGGGFSTAMDLARGLHTLVATGTEHDGDTDFATRSLLAGSFRDPDVPVSRAAMLSLSPRGVLGLGRLADGLMASGIIERTLSSGPIYQDSYGVVGVDLVEITVDAEDFAAKDLHLVLAPTDEGLGVALEATGLELAVAAYGEAVGLGFSTEATFWAEHLSIGGMLDLHVTGDGQLVGTLRRSEVSLLGFGSQTALLPGEVDLPLLSDGIAWALEQTLVVAMETGVPEAIAGLSQTAVEIPLLDEAALLEAGVSQVEVSASGLDLGLDLGLGLPTLPRRGEGVLEATRGTPDLQPSRDVRLALYDDLVNLVLYQVWRSGAFNLRLSTEDGTLDPTLLEDLGATEGTISLWMELPPVIQGEGDWVTLRAGEVMVKAETPGGKLGDELVLASSLTLPVGLEVLSGDLVFKLGDVDVMMDVRRVSNDAREVTVTRLVQELLPIEDLLSTFQQITIPLPSLLGVGVSSGQVGRDGAYTTVEADLEL